MKLTPEEKVVGAVVLVLLLCSVALGGYAFWLATGAHDVTLQLSEILK